MKVNKSDSGEDSPDWLRCFQAPTTSPLSISSDSEPSHNGSSSKEDTIGPGNPVLDETSQPFEDNKQDVILDDEAQPPLEKKSRTKSMEKQLKAENQTVYKRRKTTSPSKTRGNDGGVKVAGDEASEKHFDSHGCSSRLPLVLSEKVHRTKALVECEGESIDMSGDMGAVGRVVISNDTSGNPEMLLDLKGTIFRTTIVPSRTFCVVSFGQSEAKIEAIMNDFIQLKPQSNVFESETMIEGTLDGFSFDSQDETDKMTKPPGMQTEEAEGVEKKATKKAKGKAEKSSGLTVRRGKTIGGKAPVKKAKKKSQISKRGKTKK